MRALNQAHNDGSVDVGHNAHGKNRESPQRAAGENIQESQKRSRICGKKRLQGRDINARYRYKRTQPENGQRHHHEYYPFLEILNFQDIGQLLHLFSHPGRDRYNGSRAAGLFNFFFGGRGKSVREDLQ